VVLADAIAARERVWSSSDIERKLSHLDDLGDRIRAAGVTPETLAGHADDRPALRTKARRKVLDQAVNYERELTPGMRRTPRDQLYERALRGRWERFAAAPQPWYDRMVHHLGERPRSKNATFGLAKRIETFRERHDRATASDPAHRLAFRRALVTYMYETMARCDDSYGVLGELGGEAMLTYATLPADTAGIMLEDWCEDLCEMLAWEDHGLLLDRETAVFANVHGVLADHAERFLLALSGETAISRGRVDIARATFAAADRPGMQREYLRKRCTALTGAPPVAG
jgi:hypothetical protein